MRGSYEGPEREAQMKSSVRRLAQKEGWLSARDHAAGRMKDTTFRETFAERRLVGEIAVLVRKMRQAAGLTQAELARRASMPQSAIARLESARSKTVPSLSTLARLSAAAGIQLRLASKTGKIGPVNLSGDQPK
jgi:ribosome-binding protein aMBF1 (putative translation factor)